MTCRALSAIQKLQFEGIQRVIKLIKRIKDYSYRERLEKLRLNTRKKNERVSN